MVELSPSNEDVEQHIKSLRTKLLRFLAIAKVASDTASTVQCESPVMETLQGLLMILEGAGPDVESEVRWLLGAIQSRSVQIASIALKSVA